MINLQPQIYHTPQIYGTINGDISNGNTVGTFESAAYGTRNYQFSNAH